MKQSPLGENSWQAEETVKHIDCEIQPPKQGTSASIKHGDIFMSYAIIIRLELKEFNF